MRTTNDENSHDNILNSCNSSTNVIPSLSIYRPMNIIRLLLFVEFISILIIWSIGSKNENLVDDIIHFNLSKSIFDLLSISTLKLIILIILLTEFERYFIIHLNRPIISRSFVKHKNLLMILIILINIASLTFGTIKLIIVLHHNLSSKLNISAICIFLGMSSLEFISICLTYFHLKRLKLTTEELIHSVNIGRIFSLIQPERSWILIASIFLLIASLIETIDIFLLGKVVSLAIEKDSMYSANVMIGILLSLDTVCSIGTFIYLSIFALVGQ
jgi:hypothetical protein